MTIRSGQLSKPYNWVKNFPAIYGATNVSIETEEETRCLCVYYHDKNLIRHINTSMTYPVRFFTSGITETEVEIPFFRRTSDKSRDKLACTIHRGFGMV